MGQPENFRETYRHARSQSKLRPPGEDVLSKINFLISQPKLMLWVFKRTVSFRSFEHSKQTLKLIDTKISQF